MRRKPSKLRELSYKNYLRSNYKPPQDLLTIMNLYEWHTLSEFILITVMTQSHALEWRIGYIYRAIEDIMANKGFEWDFVEIKLRKEDKELLVDFIEGYEDKIYQAVEDVLELGYKVSISWVVSHSAYCCTVSGNENTPENNKKSVTSWSSNFEEAHAMMAYKVLKVCNGGSWEEFATQTDTWG